MMNLWKETIEILNIHNKTWNDVEFISSDNFEITKDNFERVAKNTNYDNGFGVQEIAYDIKIVGNNWWLERSEYDGAEGWDFKTLPEKKNQTREITSLAGGAWETLSEINFEEEVEHQMELAQVKTYLSNFLISTGLICMDTLKMTTSKKSSERLFLAII